MKTIRRWRLMLLRSGYIKTIRTPYGFRYTLLKSKKWQKLATREFPKREISHSENSPNGKREFPPREERIPAAAAPSNQTPKGKSNNQDLKGKSGKVSKEAWSAIGIPPGGSQKFVLAWEKAYADGPADEPLSDTMENCIQECRANGIKPTPPFYEARGRIKKQEAEDDSEAAKVASFDPRALAEKLNDELEARWAREAKAREAVGVGR